MTTQSPDWHVSHEHSEPERIIRNRKADTADSTPWSEVDFAAQFARTSRVDSLWRDDLDVLPEQSVDEHAEDDSHYEGIDKKIDMS